MLFILFCKSVFILCHSSVRGHWCPTFVLIVLIGLCPLAGIIFINDLDENQQCVEESSHMTTGQ